MADLLQKLLSAEGCDVVCVRDGRLALDYMEREQFDVLITDHRMPEMTGLELVARARRTRFRGTIILLTSRLTPDEEEAYRKLGVQKIVMKPGGILQLHALLDRR